MKKCSFCGADIKDTAKFCDECGKPKSTKKICPKCNAENDDDAKFCSECGEKLN